MKNLFKTIFDLRLKNSNNPTEDFLTEIYAFILNAYPEVLSEFLAGLNINIEDISSYSIHTQETFKKLESHDTDSRPDISIYFPNHVIFIESKIGSKEGSNQLKRYAEHLNELKKTGTLVYLTRDFEEKNSTHILKNCTPKINFISFRWFQVYQLLKRHKNNILIHQILGFMEKINISSNNQFNPVDIIALSHFSRVKKMLDETMYGVVSKKFKKVANGLSKPASAMTQLKDHDRYIYHVYQKNEAWIGLGYWMNSFNDSREYPELKFVIEVSPKSPQYDNIATIMEKICGESEWTGYNFERPKSWKGMYLKKSLRDFMSDENHITSIQEYFLNTIEEYLKIKPQFNNLI